MARYTFVLLTLFLLGASLVSVLGVSLAPLSDDKVQAQAPRLVRCVAKVVYDGDTFGCDFDGDDKVTTQAEHVRMLGIDATEMHYSRKNTTGKDQPYAVEALQLVEKSIINHPVYLEYDIQRYDKYDRTLAYAYLDPQRKTMLNGLLLQKGLARVLFIQKNRRYEWEFNRIQQQAQAQRLNLWSQTQTPL